MIGFIASDVPLKVGTVDDGGSIQLGGRGKWHRQPIFVLRQATYEEWRKSEQEENSGRIETLAELNAAGYRWFYAYTTD